ncbi:hypothetical protein M8C21_030142, partial [Ambrosia artemisiifolia]
ECFDPIVEKSGRGIWVNILWVHKHAAIGFAGKILLIQLWTVFLTRENQGYVAYCPVLSTWLVCSFQGA